MYFVIGKEVVAGILLFYHTELHTSTVSVQQLHERISARPIPDIYIVFVS